MSKKDEKPVLDVEGRAHDGFFAAVDVMFVPGQTPQTLRLGDAADMASLWARIEQAKKAAGVVVFSGAREQINTIDEKGPKTVVGKLDGAAILPASAILMIRNWGPSVLGHGVQDARVAKLEEDLAALAADVESTADALEALEKDLEEAGDEAPEIEGAPPKADEKALATVAGGDDEE